MITFNFPSRQYQDVKSLEINEWNLILSLDENNKFVSSDFNMRTGKFPTQFLLIKKNKDQQYPVQNWFAVGQRTLDGTKIELTDIFGIKKDKLNSTRIEGDFYDRLYEYSRFKAENGYSNLSISHSFNAQLSHLLSDVSTIVREYSLYYYTQDENYRKEYLEDFPNQLYWGQYSYDVHKGDFFPPEQYESVEKILREWECINFATGNDLNFSNHAKIHILNVYKDVWNEKDNRMEYWFGLYNNAEIFSDTFELRSSFWTIDEDIKNIYNSIEEHGVQLTKIASDIFEKHDETQERKVFYHSPHNYLMEDYIGRINKKD